METQRPKNYTSGYKGWTPRCTRACVNLTTLHKNVSAGISAWTDVPSPPQLLHKLRKVGVKCELPWTLFFTQSSSAMPTRAVFLTPVAAQPQPERPCLQELVQSRESLGWVTERWQRERSNGDNPGPLVKGGFTLKAANTAQHDWSSPWQTLRHEAVKLITQIKR